MPRLTGLERSVMLLLTMLMHVAVLGLVLWNRPAPPPEVMEPVPSPPNWRFPVQRPAPRLGGGGGHHGPRPPRIRPAPIAAAATPLLPQPVAAEPAPREDAPTIVEAPGDPDNATGSSPFGGGTPGEGDGTGHGDGKGPGTGDGPPGGGVGDPNQPRILESDIEPPRLVHRVEPDIPLSLLRPPRNASVKLRCVIERDGSVRVVKVLSDKSSVQRAAVDAVEQWRYEPARAEGTAISVFLTVEVSFRAR